MSWHVALVIPGDERKAMLRLRGGNVDTVWPRWVEQAIRFGRRVEVDRPLASGYVMVDFDGGDPHEWHRVRDLSGGRGFIGGEYPVSISQTAMEDLFTRCITDDGLMEALEPGAVRGMLQAGDVVRCNFTEDSLYYPWLGQEATVKWDDNRGVSIRLVFMGAETSLYVPYPEALDLDVVRQKRRSALGRNSFERFPVDNPKKRAYVGEQAAR